MANTVEVYQEDATKDKKIFLKLVNVNNRVDLHVVDAAGERLKTILRFYPDGMVARMSGASGVGLDTDGRGRLKITKDI